MSAIGVSITATCRQCHVSFPVNGLPTEAHCPDCNQALPLDWAVWRDVLASAAIDGPNAAPNEDHVEAVIGGPADTKLVRNFIRKDALCTRCKAPIPLPRALAAADHGFCVCTQCGEKISLRVAPPEISKLGGITHVIGEEAVPTARARLFYLWHEGKAHGAAAGTPLQWHYIKDVVCDRAGNLYFLDEDDNQLRLHCVDAQMNVRWKRENILSGREQLDDPQLSVTPNGFLILRGRHRHAAFVLSCADGSTALTLGGPEQPGATAHGFDLKDCASLTCDVDGTLLGAMHKRLLRWTYDGQPVETWPVTAGLFNRHHKLEPLYRRGEREEREAVMAHQSYPPDPKEIGNQPYELDSDYCELHVGFDGMLIYREGDDLVKFDRAGTVLMRAAIPSNLSRQGRVQSDGYGNTYLLCTHDRAREIIRISPDGKRTDTAVDGHRAGTPIWDGDHITVLADGSMFVFDDSGSARCFNADGSVRFITPKAREADQKEIRRREEASR